MLIGDNGTLKMAGKAKNTAEKSSAKEELAIEYRNAIMKNIKDSSIDVQNTLQETLKVEDSNATATGSEYNMDVNYKGYEFQIVNGEIKEKD